VAQQNNHTPLNEWLARELHGAAKAKAAQTGEPMAEICRRALGNWVKTEEEQTRITEEK
jgi:hypothetical protein